MHGRASACTRDAPARMSATRAARGKDSRCGIPFRGTEKAAARY